MLFENLKEAQKEALRILQNSYQKNRLSHAYIFEGEAGTKKFETALFFASLLLCQNSEQKPCGECHNCKRVAHQTHPNLHIIRPTKRQVVKEDIQQLQKDFNKTALEEGAKVYIISEADTMNQHASNSLLKFLEEPHDNIYGILLAKDASKLLPTLRSRSQTIHFHGIPSASIYQALILQGYDAFLARIASAIYYTLDQAEAFLSLPNLHDIIDLVVVLYEALAQGESLILAYEKEQFGVIKKTEDLEILIDIMMHYQKDLLYDKMNHHKRVVFEEQLHIIQAINQVKTKRMLEEELEAMLVLKHHLNHYINERLAMDNLLLTLERRQEDEK